MIIATFNVENLFERPRAMNLPTWKEGQPALDAAGELNALGRGEYLRTRNQPRWNQAIPYDTQNPETEAPQGIIVHEKKTLRAAREDPVPRGSQRRIHCWIWKPS